MAETDSRYVFEAGAGIHGPLAATGPWLAELGELLRQKQPSEKELEEWAEKLHDECFENVKVEKYMLPTGCLRTALSIFTFNDRGRSRFVLALPKPVDSEKELLLYFEGDLMPTQVQIDEVAHVAHDLFKDCSFA